LEPELELAVDALELELLLELLWVPYLSAYCFIFFWSSWSSFFWTTSMNWKSLSSMLSFLSDKKAKSLLVDDALAEVELLVEVDVELEGVEVEEASSAGAAA
jgi:hypothetical protein